MARTSSHSWIRLKSPVAVRWISLQVLLPALETEWDRTLESMGCSSKVVDVNRNGAVPFDILFGDPSANIIVTRLDPTVLAVLVRVRRLQNDRRRFYIHMHGEGAYGALFFAQKNQLLRSGDKLLCSSGAEVKCLKRLLRGPKIVPFRHPIIDHSVWRSPPKRGLRPRTAHLIYAGRISSQKNIHTLIWALWHLRRNHPGQKVQLSLFGWDDHLGSPGMGVPCTQYKKFLGDLVRRLGLRDWVAWEGRVTQGRLDRIYRERSWIFVSASLHSDEDFGHAAMRALCAGSRAVLSGWGGHWEHFERLPSAVVLSPVMLSPAGPYVSSRDFARRIHAAITAMPSGVGKIRPVYQTIEEIVSHAPRSTGVPARITPFADRVHRNYLSLNANVENGRQVFRGYSDALAAPIFRSFGASRSRGRLPAVPAPLILAPWASIGRPRVVQISDPHRGPGCYNKKPGALMPVIDVDGRISLISRLTAQALWRDGYLD